MKVAPTLSRVVELRRDFDTGFAAPLRDPPAPGRRLLGVKAGGARFAACLDDLAGVQAAPRVVPLPGGEASVLGVAGVRGRLVSVHDLAALLGAGRLAGEPRWILLVRGAEPIALAVEAVEGLLEHRGAGAPGVELIEHAGALLSLIDMSSVVAAIGRRARGEEVP